jgi:phage terminase small subunit
MKRELTIKQQLFCNEYAVDWNATRAAKAAGYSKKTAYSIGHELLKKSEIQDFIKEVKENIEKAAGVSALSHIMELKKIAYANIADFKEDWAQLKDFKKLSREDKAAISEIKHIRIQLDKKQTHEGEDAEAGVIKEIIIIKLHSKISALDSMAKILDYNTAEKVSLSHTQPLFPDDEG